MEKQYWSLDERKCHHYHILLYKRIMYINNGIDVLAELIRDYCFYRTMTDDGIHKICECIKVNGTVNVNDVEYVRIILLFIDAIQTYIAKKSLVSVETILQQKELHCSLILFAIAYPKLLF